MLPVELGFQGELGESLESPKDEPAPSTLSSAGIDWPPLAVQAGLVEQLEASLSSPVHAYLFLGPDAVGKREVARVFASELIAAPVSDPSEAEKQRRSVLGGLHPDFVVVAPRGRRLLDEQAVRIIAEAGRKPAHRGRKVILVEHLHTAQVTVAPRILKTLEEPAPSVVLLLLAAYVRPDHITVASRCSQITFPARSLIHRELPGEGSAASGAAAAPSAVDAAPHFPEWDIPAAGELQRAHELILQEWVLPVEGRPREVSEGLEHLGEDDLQRRFEFWCSLLDRLNGTGATAAVLTDEALALISSAEDSAKAAAKRFAEVEDFAATETSTERLQRQSRLGRGLSEGELRYGLAVMLNRYSAELLGPDGVRASKAIDLINDTAKTFTFNPNVKLLLVNLLLQLGALE